jgi:predicted deacetylase
VSAPARSPSLYEPSALSTPQGAAARAPRSLCISLHDVAPATWTACERVLEAVAATAVAATAVAHSRGARIPVALLIVPRYRGVDSARDRHFMRAIEARAAAGDELVLHGYTHVDEQPPRGWRVPLDRVRRRVYTAGEGEFSALARDEALRRIELGLAWFAARGWPVSGFVAPAWLMSSAARAALYETPLDYASTRAELLLLPSREAMMAPSLVYSTRSAWRRRLSLQFNRALAAVNQHREVLRLALHPADARHGEVRASWQGLLQAALGTRCVRTEGAVVAERLATATPPVLAG